eukprot:2793522-Prymnesium_polylepis.1
MMGVSRSWGGCLDTQKPSLTHLVSPGAGPTRATWPLAARGIRSREVMTDVTCQWSIITDRGVLLNNGNLHDLMGA